MAMTFDDAPVPEDDLDGHTMEELGAYLDRGRTPRDPAIEASPACRLALSGMQRLREMSWDAMQRRADAEPDRDSVWISGLLETIRSEVRAGRDVPVAHPDPVLRLTITEAAVRGLVRRTGDTMGGVVMGRCTLDGELGVPGAPIRVEVTASIAYGLVADQTAERLRARIEDALARHTDLRIDRIDVVFDDVHVP